jgi:hypothetical protein
MMAARRASSVIVRGISGLKMGLTMSAPGGTERTRRDVRLALGEQRTTFARCELFQF